MALDDLPRIFKYHVFACFTRRPIGHPLTSCVENGAEPLWNRLQEKVESEQLRDVCLTASECLSFCRAGPLMVVYPEGVWYRPEKNDDIDDIVRSHFIDGNPLERLIIIPHRWTLYGAEAVKAPPNGALAKR